MGKKKIKKVCEMVDEISEWMTGLMTTKPKPEDAGFISRWITMAVKIENFYNEWKVWRRTGKK